MASIKRCKGTSKETKGFGCGVELPYTERNGMRSYKAKYGLGYDCRCLAKWSMTTKEGKEWLNKESRSNLKKKKSKEEREERKKTRELKDEFNSKDAMTLADIYFSRYIRLKHSFEHNGERFVNCYTCPTVVLIKESDNGHFIKREHKSVRYDENNCRPQCKICNGDTKHNGKQADFRRELVNEIGEENVLELERKSRETIKADSYFYRAIATKYRVKVNEIQNEIGKIFK